MTSLTRFGLPINLDVQGRLCLVLGGDAEATDKAQKLMRAGARVQLIAEEIEPSLEAHVARGAIAWAARSWKVSDLRGAFIAFLCPDERDRAAEFFEYASSINVLACAIDAPEHCNFANPSTVRIGALTLSLSSGGEAPAVLRRLREDLERQLLAHAFDHFLQEVARLRRETPRELRRERLREAVSGLRLEIKVHYPTWYERTKPPAAPSHEPPTKASPKASAKPSGKASGKASIVAKKKGPAGKKAQQKPERTSATRRQRG